MKTLKKIFLLSTISVALLTPGCKKDMQGVKSDTMENPQSGGAISAKDGILRFKDKETFSTTVQKLSLMTKEQADAWEQKYNFTSQRAIFNKIAEAELAHDELAKKMEVAEALKLPQHSDLYRQYLNAGLIKENDDTYNYSIFSGFYAPVVNEKGIVVIDNAIYQLTSTGMKILTDGDFSKISLLMNATQTDKSNNIIVKVIQSAAAEKSESTRGMFNWSGSSGWVSSGNCNNCKRVLMTVTFSSDLSGGGSTCLDRYDINVQCQQRNFWGNWNYVFTWTTVNGSWTTYERFVSGATTTFNPTYYYGGSMNNFWTSVNPTSGIGSPYPQIFQYTASGTTFWYEDEIRPANWSATRDGGCCGLVARVNH
jgi:hypothetical protein